MKLPKLKMRKGGYAFTDGRGIEHYHADYYLNDDVKRFKKAAKKLERELAQLKLSHGITGEKK